VQSKIPVGLLICFEAGLATPTPCSILLLINFLGHTARTFFEVAEQERKRPNREAPPKEETKQKQVDQNLLSKLTLRQVQKCQPNGGNERDEYYSLKRSHGETGFGLVYPSLRILRKSTKSFSCWAVSWRLPTWPFDSVAEVDWEGVTPTNVLDVV
jgi:hypothetical protein